MSISLLAYSSSSSARAEPASGPAAPRSPTTPSASPTSFTVPCVIGPALWLLLRRRRAGLTGTRHVDAEVDGRLVRELSRQVALLVADDGDRGRLRLGGHERLARPGLELVPLEIAEHAEAVALVIVHEGERV